MTLRAEVLKNAVLAFVASTQSPPHPTLTYRPLPQGARLKNARGLNAKGGDKSTPPSKQSANYLKILAL